MNENHNQKYYSMTSKEGDFEHIMPYSKAPSLNENRTWYVCHCFQ